MFKRRKLASNCTKRCNNLIRKKRAEWMNSNRDSPYNIINDFVESDTLNRETFTPQISNREIFTPQISNGEISALQISNRETFTSQINQLPGPNIINSSNQLLTSEAEILSHSDDSCNEFDNSLISNHSINSDSCSESDCPMTSNDFNCVIKCNKKFVRNYLANWAVNNRLSRIAVNEILHLLNVIGIKFLPVDKRSFVQTPTSNNIVPMGSGHFSYFGIANQLNAKLISPKVHKESIPEIVKFHIHVDGISLSNSSFRHLWPISISLKGLELLTQPLVIACYLGPSKPENVHEYFEDFVTETIALRDNGFEFDGKLIKLIPDAFLGDAPARAFVGCFNSHNAFNGCHRCTITGISINRRTCFLQTTRLGLRSNQTIDESFYRDTSPLLKINLNLTNDIPFDPMHQVYPGVVKRYIKLLFQNKFLLNDDDILNNCLQTACNNTPCEFSRKCYSLGDYKQWKATQFRQFVLYTGVFVLKNNKIPTVVYQNFLNLHVALRLLSTDTFVQNNNLMLFVKKLLIHFVDSFKVIFGDDNCVYNVHSLLNLVDDCQRFGFSMEFFSCFRYENFLGVLKRKIKECGKQLHQLSNRICEANSLEPSNNSFSTKFNSFTVKIYGKDNFF